MLKIPVKSFTSFFSVFYKRKLMFKHIFSMSLLSHRNSKESFGELQKGWTCFSVGCLIVLNFLVDFLKSQVNLPVEGFAILAVEKQV